MNHATNKTCVETFQPGIGVRQIATRIAAAIAGPAVSAKIEIAGDERMTTSWIFRPTPASAG